MSTCKLYAQSAHAGQKRVSDPVEMVVVNCQEHVENEPGFSTRAQELPVFLNVESHLQP